MGRKGGQYVLGRRFIKEWFCNFRGTTFATRRVARNLQWRGAVLETKSTIKRSWPRFWSVFTQIVSVILPKFRWPQKKKKKIFTQIESVYFSPNLGDLRKKKRSSTRLKPSFSDLNYIRSLTNSHRQCQWGAIFVFSAKIGLKSAKNGVFCILFRAMEWGTVVPPPLGYATVCDCACPRKESQKNHLSHLRLAHFHYCLLFHQLPTLFLAK